MRVKIERFFCVKVAFALIGFCSASSVVAQTQEVVYICHVNNKIILQNTQPAASMSKNCVSRWVHSASTISTVARPQNRPTPTLSGTQIPSTVQQQRDMGRVQILRSELVSAQKQLEEAVAVFNHKTAARTPQLQRQIQFIQANVEALKRELAQSTH